MSGAEAEGGIARSPSRAAEATRRALIEAAGAVFAERGYEGASVRLITARAGANQAAITYHFGGKDGLYREVLRAAVAALEENALLDEEGAETLDREEALRRLVRQFLTPLAERRHGRTVRIFAWESVRPSQVYLDFVAGEAMPIFRVAERLARRFLPHEATAQAVAFTVFWMVQQPVALVRDAERLARPPFNLALDPGSLEALAERLTGLMLGGLLGAGSRVP